MARPETLKHIVVDSSVAVKWFKEEDHTAEALKLREGHIKGDFILAAPELLLYEVANALRYNRDLGSEDVAKAVEELLELQLRFIPMEKDWAKNASDIAFKKALTFYDAAYISAAKYLNAPLYTADKKILGAASGQLVKDIAEFGK